MPAKILFVDDEPDLAVLICQKFKKKIRTQEVQLFFAYNGVEALSRLQDNPDIDMVLTDINMPVMDGLTLLAKLNDIAPLIKTVVISAYGDLGNIRKAMNGGAFDFLTKPIDFQDLEITINKTLQQVQQLKENERSRLEKEEELRLSEARSREKAQQLQIARDTLEQRVLERTEELSQALQHLQQTQAQLIQTEKMSSLGQLVAGVAHEINNPVNFIYGNLSHVTEYTQNLLNIIDLYQQRCPQTDPEIQALIEDSDLEFAIADLPKILSSMKLGADRIRQIVLTLRNFSRVDESQMKSVNIHEGIDSTLIILQNRLKARSDRPAISIIKEYGNLPEVECYAGQLNQVFMNLLSNAIDALNQYDKGRTLAEIKIQPSTIAIGSQKLNRDWVRISIKDNGPGMSDDVKTRIFNPFFTTKPVGEGTGLGLSISYEIVEKKHGGELKCFSSPGAGTEFLIEIPISQRAIVSPRQGAYAGALAS